MKIVIFDSSTLISFAMNGLLEEFRNLRKIFNGKFIIPKEVKKEIIDKPLTIKKFKLEAMQIQTLLDDKILEYPSSISVNESDVSQKTKEMMDAANTIFQGSKKDIHLIDIGEAACLALSSILNKNKVENVIAIDERTTRMLCERPENLKKLLEKKLHTRIRIRREKYGMFKGFKFLRSTELIYVAYKKGIIKVKGKELLDALLYAMKFKGAAISGDEIRQIKSLENLS